MTRVIDVRAQSIATANMKTARHSFSMLNGSSGKRDGDRDGMPDVFVPPPSGIESANQNCKQRQHSLPIYFVFSPVK